MKTCFGNALLRVDLNHKIILKGNDNVAVLEFRPTDCWDRLTVLATEPVTVKVLKYDYVILFDNLSSTEIINRIEEDKKAKRLTEYIGKLSDKPQAVPIMSDSKIGTQDCLNRLAEYEDLEEKGLLLTLPARLGQEVFVIDKPNSLLEESVFKGKILDIRLTEDGLLFMVIMEVIEDQKHPELMYYRGAIKEFGKNMFLTESTAKSALERNKKCLT